MPRGRKRQTNRQPDAPLQEQQLIAITVTSTDLGERIAPVLYHYMLWREELDRHNDTVVDILPQNSFGNMERTFKKYSHKMAKQYHAQLLDALNPVDVEPFDIFEVLKGTQMRFASNGSTVSRAKLCVNIWLLIEPMYKSCVNHSVFLKLHEGIHRCISNPREVYQASVTNPMLTEEQRLEFEDKIKDIFQYNKAQA